MNLFVCFRTDMHSLAYNTRNHRLLMGGMQEKLIEFDLSTQRETRVETIAGGSCAIIREHGRFLCCGDATAGKIHLRDPRSLGGKNGLLSYQALTYLLMVFPLQFSTLWMLTLGHCLTLMFSVTTLSLVDNLFGMEWSRLTDS